MLRHGKATLRSGFFYAQNKRGFMLNEVIGALLCGDGACWV